MPFEELVERYRTEPAEVFEEFVRRMSGLVFEAARHFVERANSPVNAIEMEKLHGKVFENFTPQFTSGAPSMILVDFAKAIRRVLDDQAFEAIARKYYCQLPIYYVKDDQQRRFGSYVPGSHSTDCR